MNDRQILEGIRADREVCALTNTMLVKALDNCMAMAERLIQEKEKGASHCPGCDGRAGADRACPGV